MIGFASLDETAALGAPVIRLFRTGLGRDPDPAELDDYADRLRQGAALPELAWHLAATESFAQRHGPGEVADPAFIGALIQACCGAQPGQTDRLVGLSRQAALCAIANSPEAQACIPLLPGLAPGMPPDDPVAYRLWITQYDTPPDGALAALPRLSGPPICLAMPVGDSQVEAALRSAASLRAQTHPHWELVLATHIASSWPRRILADLAREEPRVRLVEGAKREPPGEVLARATQNCATHNRTPLDRAPLDRAPLDRAPLDREAMLLGLLSPGDLLAPTALHELADALRTHPDMLVLFSDEDIEHDGQRTAPRFKPALSPDAASCDGAIGQLALYHRDVLAATGGLRPQAWPHQAQDLSARAVQIAGRARVHHVPAILFHGTVGTGKTAPSPKLGPKLGPKPSPEPSPEPSPVPSQVPKPALPIWPLVSIIVCTRDHADLLQTCADGVLTRTDYPNLELLIVDNGSTQPQACALLTRLAQDARVRILRQPGPFNFAALNNAAARQARGTVLLLLNNDVDVLGPLWLRHMAAHAIQPSIGAVGAKLLYPDGTLQHAGILLGPDGAATHVGRHAPPDAPFYLGQLAFTRDLCAVTGACLAIRAQVWAAVGGMDERLAVTWNDVDLCLRVRAAGLRVVWTPHAVLCHAESATRGLESADPSRLARFHGEQALMRRIWGDALDNDPFLNSNLLALPSGQLVLTKPRHPRPWC